MNVTIKDVAKRAGVSLMTVSRVVNRHPNVRPETRAQVTQALMDLGYVPHQFARSMVSGKTQLIGLLIMYDMQKFPSEFLASIMMGMTPRLNDAGYNLTIYYNDHYHDGKLSAHDKLSLANLDGLFVLNTDARPGFEESVTGLKLPVVFVNQMPRSDRFHYVVSDDGRGSYDAVTHMISNGHRRIGLISGPLRYSTSAARKQGYLRALHEAGIVYREEWTADGQLDKESGYEAMIRLMRNNRDMTAVFAANDWMALGAMRAAKHAGRRIPEDLSIAGFDDAGFSSDLDPPLTTVRKQRIRMGEEAANLMLRLLSCEEADNAPGGGKPIRLVLPTELIVRGSVANANN